MDNSQRSGSPSSARTAVLLGVIAVVAITVWQVSSRGRDVLPADVEARDAPSRSDTDESAQPRAASEPRREIADLDAGADDRPLRVRGRIVDAWDEPLAGALVGDAGSERPVRSAADGTFELLAPRDRRTLPLLVLAADCAPGLSAHELAPSAGVAELGDIRLLRGGDLLGTVTEPDGRGIAGATLRVSSQQGGPAPGALTLDDLVPAATTDAAGAFAVRHLPPGTWRITASAPGRQSARSSSLTVRDGAATTVDPLVLAVGHPLALRVVDTAGAPIAGADVQARSVGGGTGFRGTATSAGDGRCSLDGVPPGRVRIDVQCGGHLRTTLDGIDVPRDGELSITLERGLRINGTVVDATSGAAIERFATVVRRVGDLDPSSNGTMEQQLERQLASLREQVASAPDADERARRMRMLDELRQRLERVREQTAARPLALPPDLGAALPHEAGRFSIDGLDEGLVVVGVSAPGHRYAESAVVELRRGTAPTELSFALEVGHPLAGRVVARADGAGVGGATVELKHVLDVAPEAALPGRSLYPWVFERPGPRGVTVCTVRSGDDGHFEFPELAPGRYFVAVRHPHRADAETEPFELRGAAPELRIAVGLRASLSGRVFGAPAGSKGAIEVLALGGHGVQRTTRCGTDGSFRFDDLQPGGYLVRAWPADAPQFSRRLFAELFPLHAGAVDPERIPPLDVALGEGEHRTFDVAMDLPTTSGVHGTVMLLGQPAKGCRAVLRPVPGEAPGSGGLSLYASCDASGRFEITDVPVGNYVLSLYGPSQQELQRDGVTIAAGTPTFVQAELRAGGLQGRVLAPDVASPDELLGYVWVLPGASAEPDDLYAWRRDNRTHRIRVRQGAFREDHLTPGPALLVVDLRGRQRTSLTVTVPTGDALTLDLQAGARSR
ncbi:MAG: carboxypeptidase regulatory-like domain-containing protein [Planctomycetes bacterium]|nr:carboxypeptidase regulatory-like domain-containing protein [Planctomycetota bacterium]